MKTNEEKQFFSIRESRNTNHFLQIILTNFFSIRIPEEVRDLMKDMKDVDWHEEIRAMIEELVKKKNKERLLTGAKKLRSNMKAIDAAKLIREDRDAK